MEWDGSKTAVIYLAAMMHACVEINSHDENVRVLMFLRGYSLSECGPLMASLPALRLVWWGLDWSEEQLLEMVERRLNANLTAKYPLGSKTWDLFFEGREESRKAVFDFCQRRPRDVLTYCALALETAQAHKREQIMLEDLYDARKRFSDSRLKDLGDEYQENYPQLWIVLSRFYGLGRRWTLSGIAAFLHRLIDDREVVLACSSWIYRCSSPEQFVRLLYDIGFFGLLLPRHSGQPRVSYRSLRQFAAAHRQSCQYYIHPSYWDGLDLLDVLFVDEFGEGNDFGQLGVVSDFPGALDFEQYQNGLSEVDDAIKNLPHGPEGAKMFESLVGQVLELCFFRTLYNVEPQARDVAGTIQARLDS